MEGQTMMMTMPLDESVGLLLELERELSQLKVERIKAERDEWRKRALENEPAKEARRVDRVRREPGPPPQPKFRPGASDDVVDLTHTGLTDARFAEVVRRLGHKAVDGKRCRLSSLVVAGNGLTDRCVPALRSIISTERLRVLDLSSNALGPEALMTVATELSKKSGASGSRLEHLSLKGNVALAQTTNAGIVLAEAIADGLADGRAFAKLFALEVTLRDAANDAAEPMLLGARTLGNPFSDNAILPLSSTNAVEFATTTTANDDDAPRAGDTTHWRKAQEPGAAVRATRSGRPLNALRLVERLASTQRSAVTALALTGAHLAPETVRMLCRLGSLTSLDVSFAFIGPQGASSLASHLVAGSPSLTALDVRHNVLGDVGALALAAALDGRLASRASSRADALYADLVVDESRRAVGGQAREIFRKTAASAASRKLRLRASLASTTHHHHHQQSATSTMTALDLGSNGITARGGRALALALEHAPTMAMLRVAHNPIGAEAARKLVRAAAKTGCVVHGARDAGALAVDATTDDLLFADDHAEKDRDDDFWMPAEVAMIRHERTVATVGMRCCARQHVAAAAALVIKWSCVTKPVARPARWQVLRSRPRTHDARVVAQGIAEPKDGADDDSSAWEWRGCETIVHGCLPNDVLSLWLKADGPDGRCYARRVEICALGETPDADVLALPFHSSAPIHTFNATPAHHAFDFY